MRTAGLAKIAIESSAERLPFLGVTTSARGFVWRERLLREAKPLATAISQRHGLPELMGRVLAARGVGLDDVATFLDPTLKALMPDPSLLRDMDKAAARLADAIEGRQSVAIFGDYDVDGACSSALLARFLGHHGPPARIYIPDRLFEGYGPNAGAIETLVGEGARLIVTVDCGTTSHEPLARGAPSRRRRPRHRPPSGGRAPSRGRRDRQSEPPGRRVGAGGSVRGGRRVSGSRRGYARTEATRILSAAREPDLLALLDLVALATVADVVPLVGLNRAYVKKGLAVMRSRQNVGLTALADAAGLTAPPTPYHLGFILGPRINAGGRIGNAALGATLLSTSDAVEAQRIAELLNRLNKERKDIETLVLEEALAIAEQQITEDPTRSIVVVASEAWHKGVVGLVASRLSSASAGPPASSHGSRRSGPRDGTGSLRSIPGVDLGVAIRAAVAEGLLIKGGGHAMAAGLTVSQQGLAALEKYLLGNLRPTTASIADAAGLDIDAALVASGATR